MKHISVIYPARTQAQRSNRNIRPLLAALGLIGLIAVGIYLDNHLPGFSPVETRHHP
jgi:hypothetical protein